MNQWYRVNCTGLALPKAGLALRNLHQRVGQHAVPAGKAPRQSSAEGPASQVGVSELLQHGPTGAERHDPLEMVADAAED